MWRFIGLGFAVILIVVAGLSLIEGGDGDISASAAMTLPDLDISGYARTNGPRAWTFPDDHGAHPEYQTEWWYYTGNLADRNGRRFGFQFTIFRRAISPYPTESDSEWRTGQIYMAHFTVSDIETGQFFYDQRFARGGANLAGATVRPRYRVWLEDWQIVAQNDSATQLQILAQSADFAVELSLEQIKPPALQGDNGLSAKSNQPGNASYYYSLSRLTTEGTVTIHSQAYTVTGNTWMDHEFSTSALGADARGWDWFGLIFDNNTELMIGQIRLIDGGREPAFGGLLIYPDGTTRQLEASDFVIEPTMTWESPHTGAVYPAGWHVTVHDLSVDASARFQDGGDLRFTITPLMADQELYGANVAYWEGAVRVQGEVTGYGYGELTGYAGSMTGRF
jgi:predicted secreted hydrolase